MLVHKNPRLLRRAIGALSSEGCGFSFILTESLTSGVAGITGSNIFLSEPRRSIYWAEFSNVEAEMQLIRQALDSSGDTTTSFLCREAITPEEWQVHSKFLRRESRRGIHEFGKDARARFPDFQDQHNKVYVGQADPSLAL
jgi:hypothetical protein